VPATFSVLATVELGTPATVIRLAGHARLPCPRIGLRLRRIREGQHKSLQVISGLAGMSTSTLHHVEHGRRELTLSEIVALANALQIDPWKLIKLPIFAPTNAPTDALEGREQQGAVACS
jgi:transcriptional regulator with XRE-family HTH domain